jgi:hypothetical protein
MVLSLIYILLAGYFLGAAGSAISSPPHSERTYGRGINLPLTRIRLPRPQAHNGVLSNDMSLTNSRE